jgi:hypothetical protein
VRKIRLTGGEPLLRKNIEILIEQLAALRTVWTASRWTSPDNQRLAAGAQGESLRAAGPASRDGEPGRPRRQRCSAR